jgi:NADH:ubiquinone oxidoreductase subunit D
MLYNNHIWKQWSVDIGIVIAQQDLDLGFSNVMLIGSGVCSDLQKLIAYDVYKQLVFYVPIAKY